MDIPLKPPHSHLFTVNVWLEELGDGRSEWRGKVKNIENGEEHYFRNWRGLARLMQTMLPDWGARGAPP
jgi:hypothetical protein